MRNPDNPQVSSMTVARILALSPDQNELVRRNYSRIFVVPSRDSVIDAILFQGSRALDPFIPAVTRAIAMAGLTTGGDVQLSTAFDPKVALGLFQDHFITNGWLQDENNEAYDIFVELNGVPEGTLPHITTYDPESIEDAEFIENPLCFKVGIEDLSPNWQEALGGDFTEQLGEGAMREEPIAEPVRAERPPQLATPRATQEADAGGTPSTARQPGKPGRVRFPELDGRLRQNRRPSAASEVPAGR